LSPERPTGNGAVRVAAAQYPLSFLGEWSAFEDKLSAAVNEAAGGGAQLVVFPEYAAMELASLFEARIHGHLQHQLEAMQDLLDDYRMLCRRLAVKHGLYLLGGSFPVRVPEGGYRNRAYLCSPDGREAWQDKLHMTRFESEQWGIDAGHEVKVFETRLGTLAVAPCYDVEFPLVIRRQVEAGARIILAPSCTDREAGYQRVRIGARARAMENQVYVAQAPTVGKAEWSVSVDVNTGSAGFYTPVDRGFPDDGILAEGVRDEPGWIFADLDLAALDLVRHSGQVLNHRDWTRHRSAQALSLQVHAL
jgi:predicted amidohydrolase